MKVKRTALHGKIFQDGCTMELSCENDNPNKK